MNRRDDLLRAAVYAAYRDRDEHGRVTVAAAERVVDAWVLWPLVEAEAALEAARLELRRRQAASEQRLAEAIAVVRDSYIAPTTRKEVAA